MNPDDHRIPPGSQVDLRRIPAKVDGGLAKKEIKDQLHTLHKRLEALQEVLYAQARHALLVVIQAMDAGGKDSTTRHVFGTLNPQGCRVTGFKAPTPDELAHDFLWRVHRETPAKGHIAIFNRSHYEDVLVARVKGLIEPERWQARYEHINHFERMLTDEGTHVLKFYLHITKAYQKKRLQRRLEKPDKHWKFDPADLDERKRWPRYREAYEDALSKCSTAHAPWYVIPAEHRRYRDLLVAQAVVDKLASLDLTYPEPRSIPKIL